MAQDLFNFATHVRGRRGVPLYQAIPVQIANFDSYCAEPKELVPQDTFAGGFYSMTSLSASGSQARELPVLEWQLLKESESVVCVGLAGMLDTDGVSLVETDFLKQTVSQGKHVIVDVSKVPYISSLGIGLLVNCYKGLQKQGKNIVLLKPCRMVEMTLVASKLTQILPIRHDEVSASDLLLAQR